MQKPLKSYFQLSLGRSHIFIVKPGSILAESENYVILAEHEGVHLIKKEMFP